LLPAAAPHPCPSDDLVLPGHAIHQPRRSFRGGAVRSGRSRTCSRFRRCRCAASEVRPCGCSVGSC
jgi:hypothetical protein